MAVHRKLAAALLLLACAAPGALGGFFGCVDSSTQMFGAPWLISFVDNEQESEFREAGDLAKVALYYNKDDGCVHGIKATYGSASSITKLLGVEKSGAATLPSKNLKLEPGERFNGVEYKVDKCIEYLKLSTTAGRFLTVGNPSSDASLQANQPAAGGYLGFFKGLTDVPMQPPAVGVLKQLQLFWVKDECGEEAVAPPVQAPTPVAEEVLMQAPTFGEDPHAQLVTEEDGHGHLVAGLSAAPEAAAPAADAPAVPEAGALATDPSAAPEAAYPMAELVAGDVPATIEEFSAKEESMAAVAVEVPAGAATEAAVPEVVPGPAFESVVAGNPSAAAPAADAPAVPEAGALTTDPSAAPEAGNPSADPSAQWTLVAGDVPATIEEFSAKEESMAAVAVEVPAGAATEAAVPEVVPGPAFESVVAGNPSAAPAEPAAEASVELTKPDGSLALSIEVLPSGTCVPGPLCSDGTCPTPSCALNSMGKDVPPLLCFGTNLLPNAVLDSVESPCTNIACKLTSPNCTSNGVLGIGGFCTGKVVSMGATAKLHAVGQAYLGFPCIEHIGTSALAAAGSAPQGSGDYSARGAYVAKAWKVCDCGNATAAAAAVAGAASGPLETLRAVKDMLANASLPSVASLPRPVVQLPTLNITWPGGAVRKPVSNLTLADVVAQWVAGLSSAAQLGSVTVTDAKVNALKALIPGFVAPSLVVPNISAPLLRVPAGLGLPIFTIPPKTLQSVSLLLPNISSLPSLVLPTSIPAGVKVPSLLSLANLTTAAFSEQVDKFVNGLPGLNVAIEVPDLLASWIAGVLRSEPLKRITVADDTLNQLKRLMPDLPKLPSLIAVNVSSPYMVKPEVADDLPAVFVPSHLLANVSELLPDLGPVPSLLVPKGVDLQLPSLTLPNVTLPDFRAALGRMLSLPGLPGIEAAGAAKAGVANVTIGIMEQLQDAADSLGSAVRQVTGHGDRGAAATIQVAGGQAAPVPGPSIELPDGEPAKPEKEPPSHARRARPGLERRNMPAADDSVGIEEVAAAEVVV